jgi:hypothetical protein
MEGSGLFAVVKEFTLNRCAALAQMMTPDRVSVG